MVSAPCADGAAAGAICDAMRNARSCFDAGLLLPAVARMEIAPRDWPRRLGGIVCVNHPSPPTTPPSSSRTLKTRLVASGSGRRGDKPGGGARVRGPHSGPERLHAILVSPVCQ